MNDILQALDNISKAENMLEEAAKILECYGIDLCHSNVFYREAKYSTLLINRDSLLTLAKFLGKDDELHHPTVGDVQEWATGFVYGDVFYYSLTETEDKNK